MNVTLEGKKEVFADVIKDFEMERLAWIILMGTKNSHLEFPLWLSGQQIRLGTMRSWVKDPALL